VAHKLNFRDGLGSAGPAITASLVTRVSTLKPGSEHGIGPTAETPVPDFNRHHREHHFLPFAPGTSGFRPPFGSQAEAERLSDDFAVDLRGIGRGIISFWFMRSSCSDEEVQGSF
jgi:hypothetical protein